MVLDSFQEKITFDDVNTTTHFQKNKNKLNKILTLNNEEFVSLFEMHQLYQELVKIKDKLHETKDLKEIEIIFEDYLKDGFDFYNPNKKNFIYEVIVI